MSSPQKRSDCASGLERLQLYLAELPVLPTLVARLVSLDMGSDAAYDEVVSIAEEDPTFAVRVLSAANSAVFAPRQEIADIPQAVARVGAWHISEMICSMAVMDVFAPRDESARGLWSHSIETAVGSRWLASEVPGVEKQEAYLLGLVHDLGRSVFLRAEAVEPELLRGMSGELLAYDQLAASGELITTREQALLGFDHAVVGGEAAARIGLSERLAGLIRDHHEETSDDPDLLAVVQLADAISVHAHARPDLFERPDRATLERCYPKRWQDPAKRRIDVDRLALLVPRILAESRRLTADLG